MLLKNKNTLSKDKNLGVKG